MALIEVETCVGTGTGTGFLLDATTIATVAHVVLGAEAITVDIDGQRREADVIGLDADRELALLRLGRPVRGHHFRWDTDDVAVGQPVAAIGHPLGGPLSLTTGAVSGLDRSAEDAGLALDGLVQTDTAVNPSNSGGPLVDLDGEVVGLVEAKLDGEGLGFAIPASAAKTVLASWAEQPGRVTTGCDDVVASAPEPVYDDVVPGHDREEGEWEPPPSGVTVYSTHPDAYAVADAFERYADGINTGDYAAAYEVLGPPARERTSYAAFVDGNTTSVLDLVTVEQMATVGDGAVEALVTFTSMQAPEDGPNGKACTDWTLRYRMLFGASGWRIHDVSNEAGSPSPC